MRWQGNAGLRTVPTALVFASLTLIFIALNFDLHEFVSLFLCVWTSFIAKWAVICQFAKMWCRFVYLAKRRLEPLSDWCSFRENLWGSMKRWIQKKKPRNLQELDKLVVESFTTLCTKSYCDKLYGFMPGRLDMVIESGGFRINNR